MASGGRRSGAGRPKGSRNKLTIERQRIAEELLTNGDTPLQVLVDMMRGEREFDDKIFEAAKAAAPYIHPRLAATEITADLTTSHEEWLDILNEDKESRAEGEVTN